jgi:hypothetical protein
MEDDSLGGRFWLSIIGIALLIGLGGLLIFWLLGAAWYAWGGFGALLFFGGVMILGAWIYDRRTAKKYEDF